MKRLSILGLALLLGVPRPGAAGATDTEAMGSTGDLQAIWSATPMVVYTRIASPENDDDVGGFFDQYWFTPNKSSPVPIQLGVRQGALDLFRANDTPLLQSRFASPGSNLGISGSQIDQPFFNQRLDALTRLGGFDFDLSYHRIRTEQLRIFPNTVGPGLIFDDLTQPGDRFFRDRTGFGGEARLRPSEAFDTGRALESLRPELAMRGGYERRNGSQQLRIHRDPSNQWFGLSQGLNRSVSDAGGRLLVAPKGLLTLSFDFDYQRFRFESDPITEGDLGFPPPASTRTIGFVPSSDRYTGTIRFNSRLGERAVIEGGFQISQLHQAGQRTPDQIAAGLDDNSVRYYSANAAVDVLLGQGLSFNGLFKFDRRNNDLQRDTILFNESNGTQVDPFLESWQRFVVGGEIELRLGGVNRGALGVTYEDVARDMDFARAGNPRVLPVNSHIHRDTRMVTVYGRTALRPLRGLSLNAEIGYQIAPRTGYIVDLADNFYGELRASYVVPWTRPLALSTFVRGSTGENDDFTLLSGQGPDPAGPALPRSFDRSNVTWGITASISPLARLDLYASFFLQRDAQDTGLDLSTLQRYFQDQAPILFENAGLNRFENWQFNLILGTRYQFTDRTDARLRYGFTHADAQYQGSAVSVALQLIENAHVIDSDIHDVDLEVGHWLRDGLRVFAGYRLQLYDDRAPVVESVASVVTPFGPSTHQHTVTLGVTLNSDLLSRRF